MIMQNMLLGVSQYDCLGSSQRGMVRQYQKILCWRVVCGERGLAVDNGLMVNGDHNDHRVANQINDSVK